MNREQMNCEMYGRAYQSGYDLTRRFLLSRGVPSDGAEEAAQAAWARGWERRNNLRDPERIVTWVNSIALNLFRNSLRKQKRHEELRDVPIASVARPASFDVSRELSRCQPSDRKLLHQRYVEGYTSAELARMWGCKPVAIRVRLMRARRKLAEALRSASKNCCGHSAERGASAKGNRRKEKSIAR